MPIRRSTAPLLDYHQAPLRGLSPVSVAERELIAAYVSALKACRYCHGVRQATAQAFGIGEGILAVLLADVSAAPVPGRLMALLHIWARSPCPRAKIASADAQAVLDAGWGAARRRAGVRPVQLTNRLVEGVGITAGEDYFRAAALRPAAAGYPGLKDLP